ncbi:MAG TPA: universal stress protein [Acidimicrobiia bacterium]|nr:universal stress protein [Acidimicrobiia bacterium]
MELKRVLVGIDGSPASAAAECWAADAVRDCGGEVIAVHVVDSPLVRQAAEDVVYGLGMTQTRLLRARAEPRMVEEDWCQPLRDAEVRHRTIVAKGEPVQALLHTARKEDVDLIVVGHHGDSSFVHRLFRGLSDELLDHARRPVVVVPYFGAGARPRH